MCLSRNDIFLLNHKLNSQMGTTDISLNEKSMWLGTLKHTASDFRQLSRYIQLNKYHNCCYYDTLHIDWDIFDKNIERRQNTIQRNNEYLLSSYTYCLFGLGKDLLNKKCIWLGFHHMKHKKNRNPYTDQPSK